MKILMVNKYLHPAGGAETYIFNLGAYLLEQGHEIEYFGMEHERRLVGNSIECYINEIDFQTKSYLKKMSYPFRIIYSFEAKRKISRILEKFQPDVLHLNNFNYQLTPSIIIAADEYKRKTQKELNIVYTAHDFSIICPNHALRNYKTNQNCEQCITKSYLHCVLGKCVKGSINKSLIGAIEGRLSRIMTPYKRINTIICPSKVMQQKLSLRPELSEKTVWLNNFINVPSNQSDLIIGDYVLFFGSFTIYKGFNTLVEVAISLPNIPFVFAGEGQQKTILEGITNISYVGFQTGDSLIKLIQNARFCVFPSEWYENCPISVLESQAYGTPVLGANIGGIPELIDNGVTGELFESGDKVMLREKITSLWNNENKIKQYKLNCRDKKYFSIEDYYVRLLDIYRGKG